MTPDPQEQAPDLDVIEKYCDAATAGPWILTWLRTALCEGIANSAKSVLCYLPQPQRNWQGETDMKFCVNARTDLPALVKYTRSLQARLAEAERGNRCYCAVCRTAELLKDSPVDSTLP